MTRNDTKNRMSNIIRDIKKEKPWHSTSNFSVVALIILALIDFAGFLQGGFSLIGTLSRVNEFEKSMTTFSMIVMLFGFTAAFEGATIYMAYAFSIKLYHYDKSAIRRSSKHGKPSKLSKFISTSSLGWISTICFFLGIIANTIFRVGLCAYNIKSFDPNSSDIIKEAFITKEYTLMTVMIILPIITSILNFVIGCFSFDPLLFEMGKSAKKIDEITSENHKIINDIAFIDYRLKNFSKLKTDIERDRTLKIMRATSLRPVLRTLFYESQMEDK